MKRLILVLCASLASSAALAQTSSSGGFGGFLRSLTGSLGGASEKQAPSRTSTIGIRGMDEGAATAAEPATEDIRLLEGWASTRVEAERAASKRGLVSKAATYGTKGDAR